VSASDKLTALEKCVTQFHQRCGGKCLSKEERENIGRIPAKLGKAGL
jgi:hypothetical protein